MKKLALAALLLTAACSSSPEAIEGNQRTVIVDMKDAGSIRGGLSAANKFCERFNRIAQFKQRQEENLLVYDCVKPEE
jgi:hypothetical protein